MSVWYGTPSSAARACSPSRSRDEIRMLTRLFLSNVAAADARAARSPLSGSERVSTHLVRKRPEFPVPTVFRRSCHLSPDKKTRVALRLGMMLFKKISFSLST